MNKAILKDGIAIVAGDVTVHNFDSETGEYLGSNIEYLAVGIGLPALSTEIKPPVKPDGQAVVWRGSWELMADHRGEVVYSVTDSSAMTIDYLGEVADGYTAMKPLTQYDKWNGSAWVTDALAEQSATIAAATNQKSFLLSEATTVIAPLQDAKDGGYIDDTDVPVLAAWQKYRYALTKVDPVKPSWPPKPAE